MRRLFGFGRKPIRRMGCPEGGRHGKQEGQNGKEGRRWEKGYTERRERGDEGIQGKQGGRGVREGRMKAGVAERGEGERKTASEKIGDKGNGRERKEEEVRWC